MNRLTDEQLGELEKNLVTFRAAADVYLDGPPDTAAERRDALEVARSRIIDWYCGGDEIIVALVAEVRELRAMLSGYALIHVMDASGIARGHVAGWPRCVEARLFGAPYKFLCRDGDWLVGPQSCDDMEERDAYWPDYQSAYRALRAAIESIEEANNG